MSSKGLQAKCHPNQQNPVTPSIIKRKQVQQSTTFRSPTDSLLSPCSQVLRKAKPPSTLSDQGLNGNKFVSKSDEKENAVS